VAEQSDLLRFFCYDFSYHGLTITIRHLTCAQIQQQMPTIEQLIHQPKFKDEKHKAIISILYAANLIHHHHESFLKPYGITCQQYNALRILRGQHPKPCTVGLIRERLIDRMSDASRIVERLRKADLVKRVPSSTDRRAVDVAITNKGLELLASVDERENELSASTQKLSKEEATTLNLLMEKVFDKLA
jgi:MarR family multiple gene transcriptional regulator MgrA